jgi:ubiquinone/menaquinone biosynthesis C-methylase UbiE
MRLLHALGRGPATGYGWLEALLSPTADYWIRYALILSALEKVENGKAGRLLEVSSGGWGGIAWSLPSRQKQICLLDWSQELVRDRRGGEAQRVCADGCRLPFADNSFETAISLDTLEHLPRAARPILLDELKRVTRRSLLITCPLNSSDGLFQAKDCDLQLSKTIAATGDRQPGWLAEHIENGHPTPEEVCAMLPGAELTGSENCDAWRRYATLSQRRFLWIAAALLHASALRQNELPPYRRALFLWQKAESPGADACGDAEQRALMNLVAESI